MSEQYYITSCRNIYCRITCFVRRNIATTDKCLHKFCAIHFAGLYPATIVAISLMADTNMILNYVIAIGGIFELAILCVMGQVAEISVNNIADRLPADCGRLVWNMLWGERILC